MWRRTCAMHLHHMQTKNLSSTMYWVFGGYAKYVSHSDHSNGTNGVVAVNERVGNAHRSHAIHINQPFRDRRGAWFPIILSYPKLWRANQSNAEKKKKRKCMNIHHGQNRRLFIARIKDHCQCRFCLSVEHLCSFGVIVLSNDCTSQQNIARHIEIEQSKRRQ